MKAKLNINKEAIKNALLEHYEKIVLGIFVLIALILVIGSVGREVYDTSAENGEQRTPDILRNNATQASTHITSAKGGTGIALPDLNGIIEKFEKQLPTDSYPWSVKLDGSVFKDLPPRAQPNILAVRNLKVLVGRAPFDLRGDSTRTQPNNQLINAQPSGRRWVCITGIIPYREQAANYYEVFRKCEYKNPVLDTPVYGNITDNVEQYDQNTMGFFIERIEVKASGDPILARDPNISNEFDDPGKFVVPQEPGAIAQRPAISKSARGYAYFTPETVKTEAMKWGKIQPIEEVDVRYRLPGMAYPLGPVRSGALVASPALMQPGAGPTSQVRWGDFAWHPDLKAEEFKRLELLSSGGQEDIVPAPEGRLFRFFDFDVEPGKRYRYRVKLVLGNPNFRVPPRYLQSATLAQYEWIKTPASELSPVVQIPTETWFLAGKADEIRSNKPVSGRMIITRWLEETGMDSFTEIDVQRGSLLNKTVKNLDPNRYRPYNAKPDPKSNAGINAVFTTGAMVLDIRGGNRLTSGREGKIFQPGKYLLMTEDGRLLVHDQALDQAAYQRFFPAERSEPTFRPGNTGGDDNGGGSGEENEGIF